MFLSDIILISVHRSEFIQGHGLHCLKFTPQIAPTRCNHIADALKSIVRTESFFRRRLDPEVVTLAVGDILVPDVVLLLKTELELEV